MTDVAVERLWRSTRSSKLEREMQLKIEPHFGREVDALVSDSSWQALFPFRMGYPKVEAKLSPRRAIQDVML